MNPVSLEDCSPVPLVASVTMDPVSPVDEFMPVAWLSTCILMWVPRTRAAFDTPRMYKFWVIPRPEQPDRVDILTSVAAVQSCRSIMHAPNTALTTRRSSPFADLDGNRDCCRDFARTTYDKLLALSGGSLGTRHVTASNQLGENAGGHTGCQGKIASRYRALRSPYFQWPAVVTLISSRRPRSATSSTP